MPDHLPVPYPRPPDEMIGAAARALPQHLSEAPFWVAKNGIDAHSLILQLREKGHALPAAAWAVQCMIERSLLRAGYGVMLKPEEKPVWWHQQIHATDKLWSWWRDDMPMDALGLPERQPHPGGASDVRITQTDALKIAQGLRLKLTKTTLSKLCNDDPPFAVSGERYHRNIDLPSFMVWLKTQPESTDTDSPDDTTKHGIETQKAIEALRKATDRKDGAEALKAAQSFLKLQSDS